MDYAATIDARRTPPSKMISKMHLLGSASDLAMGIEALGQIEKTINGLSYAAFPILRREALIMHNKLESHHALKASIVHGNKGVYRLTAEHAVQARHACLDLMASLIILHNAVHLQEAWDVLEKRNYGIPPESLAHICPTGTQRINWLGDLVFADSRDLRIPINRLKLVGM